MADYKREAEEIYLSGKWLSEKTDAKPYITIGACGHIAIFAMRRFSENISGMKVIDIGGGDGTILYYIGGKEADMATIIDIALTPLKRCIFHAIKGDAIKLPIKTEVMDIVFSSDMLEHLVLSDVETAIKEMARVAKNGGKVIIHTSCYGFYMRRIGTIFTGRGRLDRFDIKDGHKNRLTRDELVRIASKNGLRIEKQVFYKHLFQPLLRRIKDMILRKSNDKYVSVSSGKNILIVIIKFLITLISFYDILLFGNIPGGSII
ncbi:MAG: class I SAM-dependent methyltransferase, partial [bacterium]